MAKNESDLNTGIETNPEIYIDDQHGEMQSRTDHREAHSYLQQVFLASTIFNQDQSFKVIP